MSVLALVVFSLPLETIYHSIHIHHLHADIRYTDTILHWYSTHLTNSIQYVILSNHCSAFVPVYSGVPVISVHGIILFTMCNKPLSANIDSHSIIYHSFANDLQLLMFAPRMKCQSYIIPCSHV